MGPRFRMGRRRGLIVGAAVGGAVAHNQANKQQAAQAQEAANSQSVAPATDTNQQFSELEKLGQLKDQGILTQEEFDAKKAQILGL